MATDAGELLQPFSIAFGPARVHFALDPMKTMPGMIAVLALVAFGCRSTPTAPFAEYGTAGPGKIAILVAGDVDRPGRYYVEDGATLESISGLFGGFRPCETCGFTPSRIVVSRVRHPEETRRYSLSRTNDWRMVPLRDGDRVSYATIHF